MEQSKVLEYADIKPDGSILLGNHVVCDGANYNRKIGVFTHIHRDHTELFNKAKQECSQIYTSLPTLEMLSALEQDLPALRIKRMLSRYAENPLLEKFMTKLKNALPHMFTFALNPHIPSTNNAAERSLREIVVHRKIRGGLKSENTPNIMGNIFTCFMTWKAQGINHLAEMAKYL